VTGNDMLELQTKIKRQIEILGLCMDHAEPLKTADLADLFGCEELTVKRDLQDLRSYGIDIHSVPRRGVNLATPPATEKLRALIIQYLGLCNSEHTFDRATALMIRRLKEVALGHIVRIQRAIEENVVVVIDYTKEADVIERAREIQPLQIFQSEGYWRVLAQHDGRIKQYLLNKIISVRRTGRRFRRVPQEQIDAMFRHSFRSWVGTEEHRIRLRLSPVWARRVKPRQLMETERITEEADGSVVIEATVNSLGEVASWVVSRGEGVTVLEPKELRDEVLKLARGALRNYGVTS
jgi:predicted DNA-binding transcriptional regulator YafY